MRKLSLIAVAALAVATPALARSVDPAYRYSGTHAGGPADDLISTGAPRAVRGAYRDPAYLYAGSHAGGPANALIGRTAAVAPVTHHFTCAPPYKSAAGACVPTCPGGFEDRGRTCFFRSEGH
jgi:hypothetical protein